MSCSIARATIVGVPRPDEAVVVANPVSDSRADCPGVGCQAAPVVQTEQPIDLACTAQTKSFGETAYRSVGGVRCGLPPKGNRDDLHQNRGHPGTPMPIAAVRKPAAMLHSPGSATQAASRCSPDAARKA